MTYNVYIVKIPIINIGVEVLDWEVLLEEMLVIEG